MKANLPAGFKGGPGNAKAALKKLQDKQKEMEEALKKLEEKEYTVTCGGGMIKVTATGDMRVKDMQIDPKAVDLEDDLSMFKDLVIAGVNEALSSAKHERDEMLEEFSGSMNLGNMLGGF